MNSSLPPNAVHAGHDSDGSKIYAGRAIHEGNLMPCKVLPCKRAAYVSYNCNEVMVQCYEVLTGSGFSWIGSSNGHTPPGAVLVGKQRNGEPLYMGRAFFQGSLTPGKVHKSHGCLYIPYGGAEHSIKQYEVLVGAQKGVEFFVYPFIIKIYKIARDLL